MAVSPTASGTHPWVALRIVADLMTWPRYQRRVGAVQGATCAGGCSAARASSQQGSQRCHRLSGATRPARWLPRPDMGLRSLPHVSVAAVVFEAIDLPARERCRVSILLPEACRPARAGLGICRRVQSKLQLGTVHMFGPGVDQCDAIENGYSTRAENRRERTCARIRSARPFRSGTARCRRRAPRPHHGHRGLPNSRRC